MAFATSPLGLVALPHDAPWTVAPFAGSLAPLRGSDGRGFAPANHRRWGAWNRWGDSCLAAPPALGSTRWGGCGLGCCGLDGLAPPSFGGGLKHPRHEWR